MSAKLTPRDLVNDFFFLSLMFFSFTLMECSRFTYIYKRDAEGQLKIVLHNSGFTPAGIEEKG